MNILIIEDDPALLEILTTVIEEERFKVEQATNGGYGMELALTNMYDLIIVDWMLPELDGISVIQKVKGADISAPILMLTAKDSIQDKVHGLNAGADDYLVKPFATQELIARIFSLLRRARKLDNEGNITDHGLILDVNAHTATVKGEPLSLTSKEYELLAYFLTNRNQILTKQQIFDRIWGIESETMEGIVDLYIHYVRKKLAPSGFEKRIQTVRGVGYRWRGE
ncbi:response regulator transcription factor [Rossellomorea marisflavi]|uniref:response regulator transcription factor n=1 Tax=Rossellomorea marisflavi TaxID=189381 RepID=UPI00279F591F|nr:response regulator transcription factor [Rossellomorea marisflavi]UTE72893.1 response regulator transcription factor [Rossellomorea marisflavi]